MEFERIDRLRADHLAAFDEMRQKHSEIIKQVYEAFCNGYEGQESVLETTAFLKYFSEHFPVIIQREELLVGTDWHWTMELLENQAGDLLNRTNQGHFIADFAGIVKTGIPGLREQALNLDPESETEEQNKRAYIMVLDAFSHYIRRYADTAFMIAEADSSLSEAAPEYKERLSQIGNDCEFILENPPKTFRQALQLIWFVQIFLETEACSAALSFGRIDQYLFPFYKIDRETGRLTRDEALELIMCFYIKLSEGDESAMITVGGADDEGACADNELSLLFLEAQTYLNMRQPSISVRTGPYTSEALWQAAEELAKTGNGMPAYFHDEKVVKGLCRIGIDAASARDYGIVGCYEASPQGAYSNTAIFTVNLYDCFDEFLKRKEKYGSFDAFFDAFQNFYENYYVTVLLPQLRDRMEQMESWYSPFAGCCLKGSLSSGRLPEQYGCRYTMFGLNILGIGVLIDSIYTIKKLIFEEAFTDLEYFYQQTLENFSDDALFDKILSLNHSYGSDDEESNWLALEISELIGKTSLKHQINDHVLISPSLFWFTADIWQREYHATANGRRRGELLSYGIMPCSTPHSYPVTSILKSASHIRQEYFPNGCPLMVTLMPEDVNGEGHLLAALVKAYFKCGGSHFAANIADAEVLEQARENPQEFQNLTVKISGYSAKFVTLPEEIQNAVIQRAREGF